jgi:hypothetical protein
VIVVDTAGVDCEVGPISVDPESLSSESASLSSESLSADEDVLTGGSSLLE